MTFANGCGYANATGLIRPNDAWAAEALDRQPMDSASLLPSDEQNLEIAIERARSKNICIVYSLQIILEWKIDEDFFEFR